MQILGVDPGLELTGYGCIRTENGSHVPLEAGVIRTKKSDTLGYRLAQIYENFSALLEEFTPDVVVIEELYVHYRFPRTAIIMGHARGTLLSAAGMNLIPVESYSATRIKKSLTGNGHASKEQMQRMIMNVLGFDRPPSPPDVADALAVALCHAHVASCQVQAS